MTATTLPEQFRPCKAFVFPKRKFGGKEESGHFELSGVRRMIGYITMLAKMQFLLFMHEV